MILVSIVCLALSGFSRWAVPVVVAVEAATMLVLLHASHVRPSRMRVARALAVTAVIGSVAATAAGEQLEWVNSVIIGAMVMVIPVAVLKRLLSTDRIDSGTVYGALCLYLLAGFFFAAIYGLIDRLSDTPFFGDIGARDPVDFVYFSFVTLATVGYGDLTAKGDLGRMLAITEALLGQLYLVAVVATLVGNLGRSRASRPDPE